MRSKGLGMSIVIDPTGSTKVWENVSKLSEDIKFKLLTPIGSVVGNPEYGSTLRSMLYKPGTKATLDLISSSVYDVLMTYDGITVIDVSTELVSGTRTAVVSYSIEYNATKIQDQISINLEG
jgi:phage baseplate assembly protein W